MRILHETLLLVFLSLSLRKPFSPKTPSFSPKARKMAKSSSTAPWRPISSKAYSKSFEKKTGITVEYWRASGAAVLERVIDRAARRQSRLFDVVLNNAGPMEILLAEGALAKLSTRRWQKIFRREFRPSAARTELPHRRRRHRLQQEHHQPGQSAQIARRSFEARIQGQARLSRSDPRRGRAHVAGEPLQAHGQGSRRRLPARSWRHQTGHGRRRVATPPSVSRPARRRSRSAT